MVEHYLGMRMKNTLKLVLLALAILVASGVVGFAQDFRKGYQAYEKGDYATALQEWRTLSEQGGAVAQYNLGLMYHKGRGVLQDYNEAVKWYRKSAIQGYAGGQLNLGFMYDNGRGVLQDYNEAVKWYRKSAEQGHADAQNKLALMYAEGTGIIQDIVYAHMWFNIAVSQGSTTAIENRDTAAKQMTAPDLSKAQELARECMKRKYNGC